MSDNNQLERLSRLSVPRYATRLKPTPIPTARWDDEPLYGICINDEWISHLLGVLTALDQPDTWLGTADEIYDARQQVNEIMVAFMEECNPMSNCCPEPLTRINSDGTMDVSYDGGMTWQPATTEDPRNTAPQLPPIDDGEGADKKCKAANRVVRQMKDQQETWANSLGTGLSIAQLAFAFASAIVVFAFSLTGIGAILWPAFLGLCASLVGTGETAYNDLFTTDVWNTVLCKIYCNCGEDGQFTQSQFLEIRTELDAAGFDDQVALSFSSLLNAWQVAGLNNAAKIPTSDNLDCSDCDCPSCTPDGWTIGIWIDGTFYHDIAATGTIVEVGADYIIAQSTDRGDGQQVIGFTSLDGTTCCKVLPTFVGDPPDSTLHFYNNCPDHANYSDMVEDNTGPSCREATFWYFQMSPGTWQIKFTFVDDCP